MGIQAARETVKHEHGTRVRNIQESNLFGSKLDDGATGEISRLYSHEVTRREADVVHHLLFGATERARASEPNNTPTGHATVSIISKHEPKAECMLYLPQQ
jgi:hypothetical protein